MQIAVLFRSNSSGMFFIDYQYVRKNESLSLMDCQRNNICCMVQRKSSGEKIWLRHFLRGMLAN